MNSIDPKIASSDHLDCPVCEFSLDYRVDGEGASLNRELVCANCARAYFVNLSNGELTELWPAFEAERARADAAEKRLADLLAPAAGVDLEEVLKLDSEATPGPWEPVQRREDCGFGLEFVDSFGVETPHGTWCGWDYSPNEATARAITYYRTAAPTLAREVARLRERLRDYEDDFRKVLNAQCTPNEKHCSCVPHLRAAIARLTAERDALRTAIESNAEVFRLAFDQERAANVLALRAERDAPTATLE